MKNYTGLIVKIFIPLIFIITVNSISAENIRLKRRVPSKQSYSSLPASGHNTIIFKLKEDMGQPSLNNNKFNKDGEEWDKLNSLLYTPNKTSSINKHFDIDIERLNEMRKRGSSRIGFELPDLSLYHSLTLTESFTADEKLNLINSLNESDLIETAYFAPEPEIASFEDDKSLTTENWEDRQYYLKPAPEGLDAYYAWNYPGGKGTDIKVIDIEGNWNQTHEDLHSGSDNFHIAGARIDDDSWTNHGTAVLGEIAADSNSFGMTGIAFNVDLGTVSIGSMSTSNAILTALNNSDSGDIILIELHAPGPHYNFESRDDQRGYVAMEYWQDNFDAILQASSLGRIVVEAAGNGQEDFDNLELYGQLFDPNYRFSGAILVGASDRNHIPASFTNYGQRVDVHGFGTGDVYTLGYGDLYGFNPNEYYTRSFSGTSSASPIIVGAAAILQGVANANYGHVLDHNEIRELFTTYGTPQVSSVKHIGPLPDLQGAVDQLIGVYFLADNTYGWVPFSVNFDASSVLNVDHWTWNFGDGDSAFIQYPSHIFENSGIFDISVEIDAAGDIRSLKRREYIIALADTIHADSVSGGPGDTIEIPVYANNTVPLENIIIPFECTGDLRLKYINVTTSGCRTEHFEQSILLHYDDYNKRFTFKLISSLSGYGNELPIGSGLIAKIIMTVHSTAVEGQSTDVNLDGYLDYLPYYESRYINYSIVSKPSGKVTFEYSGCCRGKRGNINGDLDDLIDISDLVYFVEYSFDIPPGPEPPCFEEADVDATGGIDIGDIVYMVEYMFNDPSGPEPVSCY